MKQRVLLMRCSLYINGQPIASTNALRALAHPPWIMQMDNANEDSRELRIRNPYSRKQQLQRITWWIAEFFLFKLSLRPMYAWRRFVLRLFGAKLGDKVCIQRSARIEFPWNLEMGRFSSIGESAWIYNLDKVITGDFVVISQRAFLCCGTHDYSKPQRPLITKPIIIESGVWIAADAFLAPGVRIGQNSVIGRAFSGH
jgi:putative colanic acid biosynthesis acetyltransferase WcaF